MVNIAVAKLFVSVKVGDRAPRLVPEILFPTPFVILCYLSQVHPYWLRLIKLKRNIIIFSPNFYRGYRKCTSA
jgi:hypothetical protein